MRALRLITALAAVGCAGSGATPARVATTGAESAGGAVTEPADTATAASLAGYWTRYWAPRGSADGARYLLLEDGRFGWHAARGATDPPVFVSGTWQVSGQTLELVPTVGAPRALLVGDCPTNAEAQAVDPGYACVSLEGEAYFRRPMGEVDVDAFLSPSTDTDEGP